MGTNCYFFVLFSIIKHIGSKVQIVLVGRPNQCWSERLVGQLSKWTIHFDVSQTICWIWVHLDFSNKSIWTIQISIRGRFKWTLSQRCFGHCSFGILTVFVMDSPKSTNMLIWTWLVQLIIQWEAHLASILTSIQHKYYSISFYFCFGTAGVIW